MSGSLSGLDRVRPARRQKRVYIRTGASDRTGSGASGKEGIAITRSNHLVNNNTSTLYDIGDLVEVRLKGGVFFCSEILVRRRGTRQFELAGYAEKAPGRALVGILKNLVGENRAGLDMISTVDEPTQKD